MPRNAQQENELRDEGDERRPSPDEAAAPPPFTFTVTGAGPALGWAGLGVERLVPWTRPPADLGAEESGEGGGDGRDRPRREPRQR